MFCCVATCYARIVFCSLQRSESVLELYYYYLDLGILAFLSLMEIFDGLMLMKVTFMSFWLTYGRRKYMSFF